MVANSQGLVGRVLGFPKNALSPQLARKVLSWNFSDRDRARVASLLQKNSDSTISREELSELNSMVVLGDLLDVLHAQAQLALKKRRKPQAAG
jgi:hypothetical protein